MSVWRGMKSRCGNPNSRNYKWYGGKGVRIEWDSFEDFFPWAVSAGYTLGLELDRINSNGNYSPSNCWWASKQDNTMRAHLRAPKELDAMIVAYAQLHGTTCIDVVHTAVLEFLTQERR